MTIRVQPGIETAALLAHEFQQLGRQAGVATYEADSNWQRLSIADPQHIFAAIAKRRKIQFSVVIELPPRRAGNWLYPPGINYLPSAVWNKDLKACRQRLLRKGNRNFGVRPRILDLGRADEGFFSSS